MAVGFTQKEERTYTIRVTGSVSDYIWDDERIQEAKRRLDRAFDEFEEIVEATTMYEIDTIQIVNVSRGLSQTI